MKCHANEEVIWGITWDHLEKEQSVTYPCLDEKKPGDSVVFKESFQPLMEKLT